MQKVKTNIITGLFLICLQTFGQGIPKAYEAINNRGNATGRVIKFMLVNGYNGYIGAITLNLYVPGKTKPVSFEPGAEVADEHDRLKFIAVSPNNQEYFILNNMQEAYEETP